MKAFNLDTAIAHLDEVTELYIHHIPLSVFPTVIFEMPKLRVLELVANGLKEIPDLRTITLLKLVIANNPIEKLPLLHPAIGYLDFSNTQIRTLVGLSKFRNLHTLLWRHNELKTIPKAISNLEALQIVDLSHNKIKQIPESFKALQNLEKFDISHNLLRKLQTTVLLYTRIARLQITHNKLTLFQVALPFTVQHLDISNNQLADLDVSFDGMPVLDHCIISDNRLEKIPTIIAHLKWLHHLDLSGNKLTAITEDQLPKGLKRLYLNRSKSLRSITLTKDFNKLTYLSLKDAKKLKYLNCKHLSPFLEIDR